MSSTNDMDTSKASAEELEILAYLMQKERQSRTTAQQIKPRQSSDPALLSFAQERLWLLDQLEPGNAFYNVPLVLSLQGQLDVSALSNSLKLIVARHDTLRTRFVMREDQPLQLVDHDAVFEMLEEDISALQEEVRSRALADLIQAEASQPFDLEKDRLVRARLVRTGIDDHFLLFTMHHIVSDGWSVRVLFAELSACYAAFSRGQQPDLKPLAVQYADFAAWQRNWLSGDVLASQLDYWRQQLASLPTLLLPTDRPRPRVQTYNGAMIRHYLSSQLSRQLSSLARQEGVSLYMTLLATFSVLLSRYSGQDDIVVGSPIANRNRSELEGLIGFFVNSLVMRTDVSGNPKFRELVQRVNRTALGAYDHQDLPFEKLVDELQPERDLSQNPLFQVIFALQDSLLDPVEFDALRLQAVPQETDVSRIDLEVQIREGSECIDIHFVYNTDLFEAATIERMLGHYQRLLESVVADPDQAIDNLPMLSEDETSLLLEQWNQVDEVFPQEETLQQLFATQVERSPDAIAVECGGDVLSYAELDARSNQLARYLQLLGVGAEVLVGIYLERSVELLVGIVGILKAGGAYVPLDPAYPRQRLAIMLEDSAARVLLTQDSLYSGLPDYPGELVCLDRDWSEIERQDASELRSEVGASNSAYVIYTSGSTGEPKGVVVNHGNVTRLFDATEQWYGFNQRDVWTLFHSSAFDFSVWEIWGALLHGGRLVVVTYEVSRSPELFHELLVKSRVTVLNQTPSAFRQLMAADAGKAAEALSDLRLVIFGGEALDPQSLGPWFARHGDQQPKLVNMYGITETTVHVSYRPLTSSVVESGASVIGRAIPDLQIYVLDSNRQPVPIGVPGEMYVGGAGLARGYLNRPELTAQRFIAHPFSNQPEARLYQTGDLVRYLPDGDIEYLGRTDHQVKLRGFRIELGEIETELGSHEAVREVVVVAREDQPGDKRLVAYLVAVDAETLSVVELRAYLRQKLPEYMVPTAFMVLDSFPLSANGKLDRNALPVPDGNQQSGEAFVEPRTDLERQLTGIWAEVLKLERVGIHDNFFDLGGHSLMATQVVSRVRAQLGIELPLSEMFGYPTVAELVAVVQTLLDDSDGRKVEVIPVVDRDGKLPLSFAQERLWFLDQLVQGNSFYNMPLAIRLQGQLNLQALIDSLKWIVARHDTLRTRFSKSAGEPLQLIDSDSAFEVMQATIAATENGAGEQALADRLREESAQPFDLEKDSLVRARLIHLAEDDTILQLTLHHIISDGWSLGVLFRELGECYAAFSQGKQPRLAELPIQYADFSAWQRNWLRGDVLASQLDYWKQQLAGVSVLELPTDRPRPTVQTFNGAAVSFGLPKKLSAELERFSQQQKVSLFMTLLTAFASLLHRYTGQEDIVVGSPIANRNRSELEGLIGFFVNSLVMRTDVSDNPQFRELVQRVNRTALGAYDHQDLPFEKLVDEIQPERNLAQNPLFQVMFALQNAPLDPLEFEGLKLQTLSQEIEVTRFDLEVHIREGPDCLGFKFIYNTDLFDAATIERMLAHYQSLLEAMVTAPDMRIGDAPMLGDEERRQVVVDWNQTQTDYPREQTVQALFEAQVVESPDSIAVEYDGDSLGYAELNERANRLAHHLRQRGVGAEVKVGLFVERSLDMVVALLGILKAGGAYVPLDLDYPAARIAFMLDDAEVPVLLTTAKLAAHLPEGICERICLDTDWAEIEQESTHNPEIVTSADSLAYVIYTSGSTGTPKGVEIVHRAINRLVRNTDYYQVDASDRIAQASSVSFDAATFEVWGALLNGGQLVGIDKDTLLNARALAALLREKGITAMFITTAVFNQIAREVPDAFKGLKGLMFGGEAVDCNAVRRVLANQPPQRLLHVYGPTESTTFASWYPIESVVADATTVPIGRPLANTTLYVLDANRKPVPVGVSGELYIGGDGLARGYLNRPELTAERFVPNPFDTGSKLYRTGDKVRYLADGAIEFQGRFDHQVKLRGFRIELGEIETALQKHEAVQDAVAMVREDEPGDRRIAAYLVASPQWVEQISSSQSGEHVDDWQALYEETYGNVDEAQDLTRNFTGWNSSYTGEPIPLVEMEEWQASTLARIEALQPNRVLEIGCGTGLLLLQLAPGCERYVGSDFSAVAQRQLREVVSARDEFKNVELWQRTADDFSDVEANDFDTVIINSVTQYLPSMDYLAEVVEGAVAAVAAGGRIMLGDIRSLPLLKAYHTSVQLYLSPDDAGGSELLRNIQQHVEEENELVIEPAFFHALQQQIPRISHVEILLKQGQYHNELSGYRYDVILHVEAQAEALPENGQWLDWGASALNEGQVESRLKESDRDWLGISAMPNARVSSHVAVLEQLQGEGSSLSVGELKQNSVMQAAVEPHDLWQLAEAAGYQLELSYSGAGTDGRMDALFRRSRREDCAGSVFWPQQQTVPQRPWSAYGTNPLKGRLSNELIPLLRQDLQQQLPDYMMPSVYVLLDALPLNPNGKVERKALPVPGDVRASLGAEYTAPRSAMEQQLAAIWAEVLKLERVGIHDNFFDLGGHSLMATQVVSRVRAQLNVELPLSEMFGYPTVAQLAPVIATLVDGSDDEQAEVIPVADRNQPLPLSFAQERLWFLDQLQPGNPAYNISMALRLQGELSIDELTRTLNEILQRHEVLRTRFVDSPSGPVQLIDEQVSFDLAQVALSRLSAEAQQREVMAQLQEEAIRPFDLAADLLLRGTLLRLGDHENVLLLTLHHIIADGWSLGVLFRELGACYAAFSENRQPQLPALPIQYADFAVWQRAWLSGAQLQRQLDYWSRQLADLSTLDLPTDHVRPPLQSYRGAHLGLSLGNQLSTQLEALGKRSGNTLFMTLLGAYALMMHRYSAQDDVVIGSPIANRNRAELEGLIAFFVNMLVLRLDCSGNPGFAEFMKRLSTTVMGAFEHQDIPFEKLVEVLQTERDPSRNPLFQVHFALQNAPMERLELAGLTLEPVNNPAQVTRFDLECHIWPRGAGLEVVFIYNTDLFEAATIERMLGHYQRLLESMVADPDQSIDSLAMQSEAEKDLLLRQWNETDQDYPQGLTLQQLFETQVARSPAAIALEYEEQRLSYAELDALANRLARQLQDEGVGPGQLVGVHMLRSLEMVIALYAILKAGGAYVPLDPDYPQDRIAYMAAEAELAVLLTQQDLQADLPELDVTLICVDHAVLSAAAPVESISSAASADDLAYVIYTSGSTGKPKGVMNCHSGIVNRLQWMQQAYALTADDRVLQKTPYSFDVSVWEFFWPSITGARLVIARPEGHKDPVYLSRLIKQKQISTLHFVPSMLKVFLDNSEAGEFASVKRVICSGEALPWELQQQFFSLHRAELHNLYGPTEAAVDVSYWACRADDERPLVPIGHPVANTRLYILDRRMQPVPLGVSGELYIGGVQVARGYLGQPELTAEKFITDPFSERPGARLYRTGDLARYLSDGAIEYLGRIDNQIKLRGLRIELGEIETELGSHEAVREVVVVAREDQPGDKRLVAYLVPAQGWLERHSASYSGEHVSEWQTLYEETYRQGAGEHDARFNIVSWNSSYTGEPIAIEQMREWVDVTVARISALQAKRVLEIGCGTGLLLYRLAPHCERYVGADFSRVAQQQLGEEIAGDEALRHVELWHRSADDFSGVDAGDFDLVVINSVVQYLPSVDYLLEVLSAAVAGVGAGGQVFVGDLRSFALLTAYHASVEVHRAANDVTGLELLGSVQQHVEEENELVVEPAFFHALKQRIPRISHVEVLLKRGEHINELSAFRYDVILHVEAQPMELSNRGQWHDWGLSGYDEAELEALLAPADRDWLGIHAIPNARTAGELVLLEQLQGENAALPLADLRAQSADRVAQAVDPARLWRLAERCGYELELGYSGSGADGRMEALFRRGSRADSAHKLFWDQAQTPGERRCSDYASNPLKGRLGRELIPQLKEDLRQSLPEYMLPSAFVVLDALPLSANGKVDRRALPVPGDVRVGAGVEYVAPRNEGEAQLAVIWAEVLKLERVGVHDNFFDMGGHSLIATQVVSRMRAQLGIELPLSEMFGYPTVAGLAQKLDLIRWTNQKRSDVVVNDREVFRL